MGARADRLREREHYDGLGIRLVYARACGLDAGQRVIEDDGRRPAFDGLVIATGAQPRRLPAGHHLAGVHVLRGHPDVAGLRAAFEAGQQVVIVGAGFLGTELAAAARAMDLDVTVVDPLAQPMIRQVGPEIGGAIAQLHRDHGVQLRTGVGVRELTGANGQVTAVALDDGSTVGAGCVLVASAGCGWSTG